MINIGSADRTIRFVTGFVLLLLSVLSLYAGYFEGWGAWRIAVGIVGLVLVVTATVRVCPAYLLLGVRTCKPGKA
ncbi:MAG: DUF2892 domain-containing protein [Betaproteobacteria bacterium]|jgi:hypothetical protein